VGNNFRSSPISERDHSTRRVDYFYIHRLIYIPQCLTSFLIYPLLRGGREIFEEKKAFRWATNGELSQDYFKCNNSTLLKREKWQLKRRRKCRKKGNNARIILSLNIWCIVDKLNSVRGAQRQHRLEFRQSQGAFFWITKTALGAWLNKRCR